MLNLLEKEISTFYDIEILPNRKAEKELSQDQMTDFYYKLEALISFLIKSSYKSKLNSNEKEEVLASTVEAIVLRLHKNILPVEMASWLTYIQKTLHGIYVNMITQKTKINQELELVDYIEDLDEGRMTLITTPPAGPDEVAVQAESSKAYLKNVLKETKQLSRGNSLLALLGFYVYRYEIDVSVLPLTDFERSIVTLVSNAFDYHLRDNRPEDVVLPV